KYALVSQSEIGDALRESFQELHRLALHDIARGIIHRYIIERIAQIVRMAGGVQVALQFDIHDELLPQLFLGRVATVTAKEGETVQKNSVHRFQLTSFGACCERRSAAFFSPC